MLFHKILSDPSLFSAHKESYVFIKITCLKHFIIPLFMFLSLFLIFILSYSLGKRCTSQIPPFPLAKQPRGHCMALFPVVEVQEGW